MQKIYNYINGALCPPSSDSYMPNVNPATAETYSWIPDSDERDVELAVRAAEAAFPAWSQLSASKRSEFLLKIAKKINEKMDALALAESIDNGKPLSLAKAVDIPRAEQNFSFFATAILHEHTDAHISENKVINYTLKQPIGVVACISPWNLPLYLFSWKIAPALAAGNCVVAKPSEITPMTAFLLSEICIEIGLPAGVLNIIHGLGAKTGQSMVENPKVKAVSFTGGTSTGAKIAAIAAPQFKKLSLELGGKNPCIIFSDCNYKKMMQTTVKSSFANQGQICLCSSRIFIEKSIYEQFKIDFVNAVKELRLGDPLEKGTQVGAVVSKEHQQKILSYIETAKEEGATILCGGNQEIVSGRCEAGFFVQPTVLEGLSPFCRTNQEEIFGPVVTLTAFETEEEVLSYANSVKYGLSAVIWTENINKASRMAMQLEAGIIWTNTWLLRDLRTPFGGMKDSGIGREGGFYALNFFTETKNICIDIDNH